MTSFLLLLIETPTFDSALFRNKQKTYTFTKVVFLQ